MGLVSKSHDIVEARVPELVSFSFRWKKARASSGVQGAALQLDQQLFEGRKKVPVEVQSQTLSVIFTCKVLHPLLMNRTMVPLGRQSVILSET